MYLHRGWGQRHEFCFLTYGVIIHSPSTLHSQSRTLSRAFSPLRAKIAYLVKQEPMVKKIEKIFGKVLTKPNIIDSILLLIALERYRSGHNEAVLKTVCPQGRVGSNPTLSVTSADVK